MTASSTRSRRPGPVPGDRTRARWRRPSRRRLRVRPDSMPDGLWLGNVSGSRIRATGSGTSGTRLSSASRPTCRSLAAGQPSTSAHLDLIADLGRPDGIADNGIAWGNGANVRRRSSGHAAAARPATTRTGTASTASSTRSRTRAGRRWCVRAASQSIYVNEVHYQPGDRNVRSADTATTPSMGRHAATTSSPTRTRTPHRRTATTGVLYQPWNGVPSWDGSSAHAHGGNYLQRRHAGVHPASQLRSFLQPAGARR